MPGINGLELIENCSQSRRSPGLHCPGHGLRCPGLKEAPALKVNDVINKPIRPERICQIIAKAIQDLGNAPAVQWWTQKPPLKILIADDRADNVTLLSRYLENEGYLCLTASDGEQALRYPCRNADWYCWM